MEDLAQQCNPTKNSKNNTLPELTQYSIKLPFRVVVVGQTDSGKTQSIMHRWLGEKISYWRPDENEHVLRINDSLKGNRRASIFICFTPGLCTDCFGTRR